MPVRTQGALDGLPVPELGRSREHVAKIHRHLRQLIMDEQLSPGAELNQAELSRFYGVSRIPIREALRLLQQEGLIEMERNQRAVVRQLDAGEVDQLYAIRITLEGLGVRITAGALTEPERQEAESHLERMRQALAERDMHRWIYEHRLFHRLCSARADTALAHLIESLSERSERYLRFAQVVHPDTFTRAECEHREILHKVVTGDGAGASHDMARHLATTAALVVRDLGGDAESGASACAAAMVTGRAHA